MRIRKLPLVIALAPLVYSCRLPSCWREILSNKSILFSLTMTTRIKIKITTTNNDDDDDDEQAIKTGTKKVQIRKDLPIEWLLLLLFVGIDLSQLLATRNSQLSTTNF